MVGGTEHDGAQSGVAEPVALRPMDPVDALRGVGPHSADLLRAAGVITIGDLLLFFPRRHREIVELDGPDDRHAGATVRLRGRVERTTRSFLPGRRSLVTVTFAAPTGVRFRVPFFNQPWLTKVFEPGVERQLEGRLEVKGRAFSLVAANVVSPRMDARGACVVRYPPIEGVSEPRLRTLIDQALRSVELTHGLGENLPVGLQADSLPLAVALRAMHQPQDVAEHERARRSFALREAVMLFRRLERVRRRRRTARAPCIGVDATHEARIARVLPWSWTADQARAVRAIRERLHGPAPAGVLLQGDVGTGKTAVALDAMLATVGCGRQAVLLTPTELLAEQHHVAMRSMLAGEGVRTGLLCGGAPTPERREVERSAAAGSVDIVVGTHALLGDGVRFARLGLVVVDEQHRFGVEQRARLVAKGVAPHVLVMTATPIPRTLTLARFGDLDVEVLRERPHGRPPAPAVFVARREWPRVLRAIGRHVRRGGRVFVVCPRVGEDGGKGGAVLMVQELARSFRCELVHARMEADARRAALQRFTRGACDVLVGTTVLEVGVDVADATLMVVVGAERFGLAQLHQLRGRVGRGTHRGVCILTGAGGERCAAVCGTRDGFALAEQDLRLRGAGELLGAQQSGAFDFRALDPIEDYEILRAARDAVRNEEVLP